MPWQEKARCHSYDPEIFFDPRVRAERRAKAICGKCAVRTQCLAVALESRAEFGVWGGLNGKERRSLIRRTPKTVDWVEVAESIRITA